MAANLTVDVLDPAELEFRFDSAAMFLDLESGRDLYIDPVLAREEYLRNLGEHNDALTRICQELGIETELGRTEVLEELMKKIENRM